MSKTVSNRRQLNKLVELMEENPTISKGICSKHDSKNKWEIFAVELNSLGPPERTWDKWHRVWIDMKCKTKKKLANNKAEISTTGGGPNRLHILTDMEESVNAILQLNSLVNPPGQDFGLENTTSSLNEMSSVRNVTSNQENASGLENTLTENSVPKSSSSTKRSETPQNVRTRLLEEQTTAQKNFYEKVGNVLCDIKKSIRNTEDYTKRIYKLKEEKKKEIIGLKKEKLEVYKCHIQYKQNILNEKLKVKLQLLELEKQRVN